MMNEIICIVVDKVGDEIFPSTDPNRIYRGGELKSIPGAELVRYRV